MALDFTNPETGIDDIEIWKAETPEGSEVSVAWEGFGGRVKETQSGALVECRDCLLRAQKESGVSVGIVPGDGRFFAVAYVDGQTRVLGPALSVVVLRQVIAP